MSGITDTRIALFHCMLALVCVCACALSSSVCAHTNVLIECIDYELQLVRKCPGAEVIVGGAP